MSDTPATPNQCPYCDCAFEVFGDVFHHLIDDHFDGMPAERTRPLGSAIEISAIANEDGVTTVVTVDFLLKFKPEPGAPPNVGAFGRIMMMVSPDEARALGYMLIEGAKEATTPTRKPPP